MSLCDAAEYLGEAMWDACRRPIDPLLSGIATSVRYDFDANAWDVCLGERRLARCDTRDLAEFFAAAFEAGRQAMTCFDVHGLVRW